MIEPSFTPFDLTGEYGGIVFNDAGKRRLRLRLPSGELLFKVPRDLRRRIIAHYRAGQPIRLIGSEERDPAGIVTRRLVDRVVPPSGEAAPRHAAVGPILVCTKKNCWRKGGKELWTALEEGLAAAGLAGQVDVKGVGCMDRCRMAPNAEWQGCAFRQCTPEDVGAIIAQVAGQSGHVPARRD